MFFVLLLSLLLITPGSVYSQDVSTPSATIIQSALQTATPTPDLALQYKNDYLYQYGLYNTVYIYYVNKFQTDSQYHTITTKKDKYLAGKEAIIARNRMLRSYLMFLRLTLNQYLDGDPSGTQKLQAKLGDWENWLQDQAPLVSAINNEPDLTHWATGYQTQYVDIQTVIYSSLVQHESNRSLVILSHLQSLARLIKAHPQFKPEGESWLNDINIKSNLINQSLDNAFKLTQKENYSDKFKNFYPGAQVELSHATGYLIEMKNDLWATLIKYFQS